MMKMIPMTKIIPTTKMILMTICQACRKMKSVNFKPNCPLGRNMGNTADPGTALAEKLKSDRVNAIGPCRPMTVSIHVAKRTISAAALKPLAASLATSSLRPALPKPSARSRIC